MSTEIRIDQTLDASARDGIARLVDVLLPGTSTLPPGRTVGADSELLHRVLAADPRLVDVVGAVGSRASEQHVSTIDEVVECAGDSLDQVIFALQAAYYLSPLVQSLLGYPGQMRRPISQATSDELHSDDLLAPVKDRGPIYVPTPPGSE